MHFPLLTPADLPQLLHFHPIDLNGVAPKHLGGHPIDAGVALVFTPPHDHARPLLTIGPTHHLTHDAIATLAKSDYHLRAALAAHPALSATARGASIILILLRQSTLAGLATPLSSVRDLWSHYIQFLPSEIPVPTTWIAPEQALLAGTSLESAVAAKLRALNSEFETWSAGATELKWWDIDQLTLEDWVHADSLFRSRSLDLPGAGAAMIPVLDFANHAGGAAATARFAIDAGGVVELELVGAWEEGQEATIDYAGGDKSAAEMAFSYGFIPAEQATAGSLTLDLNPSDDDPLGRAKTVVWRGARTVRVYEGEDGSVLWDSPFAYLCVINEEDSLEFHILQDNTGARTLQVLFSGEEIDITNHPERLLDLMRDSELWAIFRLRAVVLLRQRVEAQLHRLVSARGAEEEECIEEGRETSEGYRPQPFLVATRLRTLEETLLLRAIEALQAQVRGRRDLQASSVDPRIAG